MSAVQYNVQVLLLDWFEDIIQKTRTGLEKKNATCRSVDDEQCDINE